MFQWWLLAVLVVSCLQGRSDGSQLIEADAALTADGVHGRWRRHIGSVAAFGGFPISYNRNRANRPLSSAIISHQSWPDWNERIKGKRYRVPFAPVLLDQSQFSALHRLEALLARDDYYNPVTIRQKSFLHKRTQCKTWLTIATADAGATVAENVPAAAVPSARPVNDVVLPATAPLSK